METQLYLVVIANRDKLLLYTETDEKESVISPFISAMESVILITGLYFSVLIMKQGVFAEQGISIVFVLNIVLL